MSEEYRNSILTELAKHTGRRVDWRFIKQTAQFIPHIDRFHNLITGIFKPAWSEYALSIVIGIDSPYNHKDEVIFLEDGRWLMTYSPRVGGLKLSDNRSLVRCMDERVPIAVLRQLTDKTDRKSGSTYRILGLGIVTEYHAASDVFLVESSDLQSIAKMTDSVLDEGTRYEVQLYAQIMNKFRPFVKEESVTYTTTAPRRDKVFRDIVVREYEFACAVCEMKFWFDNLFETTAAHIIPKHRNGSDDPRNGLSLCRTHHWAFDNGFFALTDDYEILLSPFAIQANSHNFMLLEMDKKPILLPRNESVSPHVDALEWHRRNVWRK